MRIKAEHFGGECLSVYYPRLQRDGWELVERTKVAKWKDQDLFEKPAGPGWRLRKVAHAELNSPDGKGCYWDEHQLVQAEGSVQIDLPDWEWADVDGDRLVWAAGGKLLAGSLGTEGLTGTRELHDFNSMQFQELQAPY